MARHTDPKAHIKMVAYHELIENGLVNVSHPDRVPLGSFM